MVRGLRPSGGSGRRRTTLRLLLAALAVAAVAVVIPGAIGAVPSDPASIVFNPQPLGSWAAVGNTLNVDPGVWANDPSSITVQWYRCNPSGSTCAAIAGATSVAWTLQSADLGKALFAVVTATNFTGHRSVSTYLTGVVGAPTVSLPPTITGDANVDGSTLSASTGTWTGSPTAYTYQWLTCDPTSLDCTEIPGATASTYQVNDVALNGSYLTVDVRATNAYGSADNAGAPSFAVGVTHTDIIESPAIPMRPESAVFPSWTGDASETGNVLVADPGVFRYHPTTLNIQWEDCDASASNCTQIPNTNSLDYTVRAGDAGHHIFFVVFGSNLYGQGPTYFGGGTLVDNTFVSDTGPGWAPEPAVPPELHGNAMGAGSVISLSDVQWSSPHDLNVISTYTWVRCDANGANCVAIPGANASSYTLTVSDLAHRIYAIVDGTNSYGTTSVTSTVLTPPIGAPISGDPPMLNGDTSNLAGDIHLADGTWLNTPTQTSYAWYRCDQDGANCALLPNETTNAHPFVTADTGNTLIGAVTATNADGSTTAYSAPSGVIGAPWVMNPPVLSSTDDITGGIPIAELGDTLTVTQGTWDGSTGYGYQWYRCDPSSPTVRDFTNCAPIGGATSPSYTTVSADLGHEVYGEVDATNGVGTSKATVAPHGSVGVPQPLADDGSLEGTAQVGQTLTFVNGTHWAGDVPISFRHQWNRCDVQLTGCAVIAGATADTYTLTSADQGYVVWGEAFGSNVWGGNGWGLAYNSAVVQAAPAGGGRGGGGGGADLGLALSATTLTPTSGSEDDFAITVSNTGGTAALQVHLLITLPAGVTLLGAPYFERGSGCVGTQQLDCFLDTLGNGKSTVVKFSTRVTGTGAQTLSAQVTASNDSSAANNSASLTLNLPNHGPVPPPAVPNPVKTLAAPALKPVGSRTLSGVRHATSEVTDGKFAANEPLKLTLDVTPLGSTHKLSLLKGTRLGTATVRKAGTALSDGLSHAGTVPFHVVLHPGALVRGKTYVVHVGATNAQGQKTILSIRFRA